MIEALITILVVALLLFLIYYIVGMFMGGRPLQIVGIILGLLFLLYAIRMLRILTVVGLSLWPLGCASVASTLTNGHPNRDRVPVEPGSRAVMMTGTYDDIDRDGWLDLPRGAGPFVANNGIVLRGDETIAHIWPKPNLFLIGNIVYGGLPGLFIDVLGGGAWNLHPHFAPQ